MNSTYEDNKPLQRAEEVLSKIALKYKAIFESNMDAVVCMDTAGKIFSWNVHAEKLFGWKASEIIGKTVADTIVPPQYRNSHIKGLQHYLATEKGPLLNKITETTAINSEGNQFPVELTIIPFLEDGIRFFCAFIRDITHRKNAEASIQLSYQRLKDAETIGKTGYWHWDAATGFVVWSEGTHNVFGEKQGNFNGTLEDFIQRVCSSEREIIQNKLQQVYQTKIPDRYEFWIVAPSGERRFISTTAEVILDENGSVSALFGTTRDNTEQKKSQEKEKKYTEIQGVLAELNKGVHRAGTPEEIYELALDSLHQTTGADKASIMLFDNDNVMRFVACRNLSVKYKKAVEGHSPWKAGESDAKSIFIPDVQKEQALQDLLPFISEEGIAALAFIPLVHQQQLLGKLVVYFTDIHNFSADEIQVIQSISGVVAFAIWEKRAAIALRESEEKYRAFFESSIDGILLVIPDEGKIIAANAAACEMLGMNEEEICRLGRAGVVDKNDPQFAQFLKQRQQKGKVSAELNLIRKDGSRFPVEASSSFFYDAEGNEKASFFFRDITERKKNEEALAKSELYLRSILHSTNDGILAIDNKGKVITANNRFAELWRIPSVLLQQNDDKTLLEFVLDQLIDPKAFLAKVQELYKSDKMSFDTLYFKDDRVFERFSTPLVLNSQIVGRVWSFRDVTIQTKIEKSLRESEQRTRHVLSSTADTFYVIDRNFHVTIINESAEKNLEIAWGKKVKTGTDVLEVIPPQSLDSHKSNYNKVFAGEKVEYERRQTIKGLPEWAHISFQPVSDEKGNIIGAYIVSKDITERKRAEEELIKSKKQFQSLIENISGVYWVNDLNRNRTLYISPSFETIWGRKCEELYKDPAAFIEAIHPDDKERLFNAYRNIQNISQLSLSYRIIRPDGEIRWILARINVVDDHEGQKTEYGYAEDITEQKNAETIVRESENRLRTIYETEPECIKLLNSKGELLEMNPAGLAMIEADNLDMVKGKQVLGIVAPEYRNKFDRLTRNVFNGQSGTLEFKIVGLKGTHRWLETHAVPMKDASGNIIALLGVTRNITESKKAEQALKESEEKYRTLVEQASDGILVTDLQGIIIDMNSRLCAMFGYSKEEVVNKNVVEFLHPENIKQQPLRFNQLFGDQSLLLERVAVHRDGTVFDIELNTKLISNNRALSVIRNISERKKAEQLLRESEERYKALVENAPEALVVFDINEKKFVNVSETAGSLFKMTKDELLQIGPVEVSPQYQPDGQLSADLAIEKINLAIMGDKPSFEWTHRDKEGNPIPCEVRLVRLPSETKILVRGSIIDITDRKKAEQALKESEEKYRTLVEQASDPIVIYSLDGKILDYNHAFMSATGYQKENLEKMSLSDLLFEEDLKSRPIVFGGIKKGLAVHDVRRIKRKDGTAMSVELNSKMMPDGNIMVIGRDITERKKAEKELEDSYRAIRRLTDHLQNIREEERTHIAREIHDELGQQLTVMKMDISWINKKIAGSNDISMKEKTKELMALLDQTVKTVRRISSELRPSLLDDLGLTAAMEWQLHEFGRRSGIKTSLEIPPTDIKLSDSHKTGLFRIFQESLTNVARHSKAKQVDVVLSQEVKKLVLSITDNGHGFDKQKIAEKKTLGILGMKERTSMIGGSYEITSTPGKGTRVVVTIPLIKQ